MPLPTHTFSCMYTLEAAASESLYMLKCAVLVTSSLSPLFRPRFKTKDNAVQRWRHCQHNSISTTINRRRRGGARRTPRECSSSTPSSCSAWRSGCGSGQLTSKTATEAETDTQRGIESRERNIESRLATSILMQVCVFHLDDVIVNIAPFIDWS